MRVLVVGLGSIGRRHLSLLRAMLPEADITVWRQHAAASAEVVPEATRVVYSAAEALAAKPQVAVVANPASLHVETARLLAEAGVHLLLEKPLAHTAAGVPKLLDTCRRRGLILMVGYTLRFHPGLQTLRQAVLDGRLGRVMSLRAEVGQYLPDWRPGTDYRQGVSAREELGGGAILELSHELDYAAWIGGPVARVSAFAGKLSDLELAVEDTAEILLQFASGAVGSVHVDFTQRTPTRTCKVVGTQGTAIWDAIAQTVRLYSAASAAWTDLHPATLPERNALYRAQLEHFLNCVQTGTPPLADGEAGWQTLRLALAAKEAARTGTVVALE